MSGSKGQASMSGGERRQQSMEAAGTPSAATSRSRRRLFVTLSMLLPVVLFLTAEVILRAIGIGGYPPAVMEIGDLGGRRVVTTYIPGAASYFDTRKSIPGAIGQYAFFSPKTAGTVRIVLVGGSAIKGFPQPPAFAPSAFLTVMLEDTWPDRTVETINLGTTAVASYPALQMMTEMLDYEPDLVVIYTGHNEFFGAYGVASLQSAGNSPSALRFQRWFGSLGIVQALARLSPVKDNEAGDRALMELMVGRSYIGPADPLRQAAARNLQAHVGEMIDRCRDRGVTVIVCTLASNERDLAPIGEVDVAHLTPKERQQLDTLVADGTRLLETDPAGAADRFNEALRLDETHAINHFRLGQARYALGDFQNARRHFQRAIDLDTMPWRAPSKSMDAIRAAAAEHGAVLCDVEQAFREQSPGGCIGRELMDDHVHGSLEGQSLVARAIVGTMTALEGTVAVPRSAYEGLPPFAHYAQRLGANRYEQYAVAHTLRSVFAVPFVRQSNPHAYERCDALCKSLIAAMSPSIRDIALEWQDPKLHRIIRRPLSGMVARALMRQEEFEEAEQLMGVARNCVPAYSTWNVEYTYFQLVCRQKLHGSLDAAERQLAGETIERIEFMTRHGTGNPGLMQRFRGRLHQLRGEYAESIPSLLAARDDLWGMEKVANDAALVEAYVKTGDLSRARELAHDGIAHSNEFAKFYREFLSSIPDQ